jgi:hypothetical protein
MPKTSAPECGPSSYTLGALILQSLKFTKITMPCDHLSMYDGLPAFIFNCRCFCHRLAVKGKGTVATWTEIKDNFHLSQAHRRHRKSPGKNQLKSCFLHFALPRSHPTHRPTLTQKSLIARYKLSKFTKNIHSLPDCFRDRISTLPKVLPNFRAP